VLEVAAAPRAGLGPRREPTDSGCLAIIGGMKITSSRFAFASTLALTTALLAGCGGGDSAPGFDVQAAISAMFQTPASYAMAETLPASQTGGTAVDLSETDTFAPGAPADPRVGAVSGTVLTRKAGPIPNPNTVGSTVPVSGTETYYYTSGPFRLVARIRDNLFGRYTTTADLPTRAQIGESGAFATFALDQSGAVDQILWRVEAAELPGTAWVCLVDVEHQFTLSQCVRVDANGTILGARVVNEAGLLGLPVDLRSPVPAR
jgi:hypothetical protein